MASSLRNRGLVRQWKIVRALQASTFGMTFRQLADVSDDAVSERTIRRDIDTLTLAGFPVDVESGKERGLYHSPAKVFWREETVN